MTVPPTTWCQQSYTCNTLLLMELRCWTMNINKQYLVFQTGCGPLHVVGVAVSLALQHEMKNNTSKLARIFMTL